MTDIVEPLGRVLIGVGLVMVAIGVVLAFGPRIPVLGHLPGDIVIQRDNATIYMPPATMLLVSVLASLLLSFLGRR